VEEIEKKDFDLAQNILEEILLPGSPAIDRPSQEKALYKLATLLVKLKKHAKAVVYLKDCLKLYPDNPNAIIVRDYLGECYREMAQNEAQLESVAQSRIQGEISDERRQQLEGQARNHRKTKGLWLEDAIKTYRALADELETRKLEGSKKNQPLS